jgi:hypothetical protein
MEKDYIVQVIENKKNWLQKQKFHWRVISFYNKQVILTSETYSNKDFCFEIAKKFAVKLGADFEILEKV